MSHPSPAATESPSPLRFIAIVDDRRPGLPPIERYCLYGFAFTLTAFNGRPEKLSSGFFCLLFAGALVCLGLVKGSGRLRLNFRSRPMAMVLGVWTFIALLATVANAGLEPAMNFFWGWVTPLVMFVTVSGLEPNSSDIEGFMFSLAAGCIIRFGYGAFSFYSTWGLQSLDSMLMAHFDLIRNAPYMSATFGNTSDTAPIIATVAPVLLVGLFMMRLRWLTRAVLALSLVLLGLNALMTGSRAVLLVMVVMVIAIAFLARSRWRYPIVALAVIAVAAFSQTAGSKIMDRFAAAASLNAVGDESVSERFDSMRIGLGIMSRHPLGVGPGMSYHFNKFDVAHQFAIEQGSELGVLGLLAAVALAVVGAAKILGYRPGRDGPVALAFRIAALSWLFFAMTTNLPVNSGPVIAWIGLFVVFAALGDACIGLT